MLGLNSKQMSQDLGEFKKQLHGRRAKTQKARLLIANLYKSMFDCYVKMSEDHKQVEDENKNTQT